MNKTEFSKLLTKRGYRVASSDDGVPTVLCGMEAYKGTIKEVKALVKECGYDQSFAIKKADSAKLKALSDEDMDNADYGEDAESTGSEISEEPQSQNASNISQMDTDISQNTIKTDDGGYESAQTESPEKDSESNNTDEEAQITTEPDIPDTFDIFSTDNWLFDEDTF